MAEEEKVEEEKPKRKPKRRPVRVVARERKSALVEWNDEDGRLKRGYVEINDIKDDGVDEDVLEEVVPYGVPWERVGLSKPSGNDLAHELRKAGIWTLEDLSSRPAAAIGALQSLYGVDLAELLRFANRVRRNIE